MSHRILILNGPNLNMLGTREPEIYGHETLDAIKSKCQKEAERLGFSLDFRQTNHEGELVGWIQQSRIEPLAGMVLNAAALTHTSVAVMDALLALTVPIIEVHLSNIFRREEFRHHSYVAKAAKGIICGFGSHGYILALQALKELLSHGKQ